MVDLRSDTVTKPTAAMRAAMANAEVGDDVYGEDPTVLRLEETAAELLGKAAALFVTSGTQGNQVAVLAHTRPGDEVIVEADAHIYYYEVGAMAALAGVQARAIAGRRGQMEPTAVRAAIRGVNIHFPTTSLLCVENTHNRAGGAILPLAHMQQLQTIAKEHGVAVHLDGARLFNAVAATGIPAADYARMADSVQICLSKGLSAPVGSLLAGDAAFIQRARKWRKALGGGMRQAGVIAAPGLLALTTMTERLEEDHARARHLADGLAQIKGLCVDVTTVETNIVIVDIGLLAMSVGDFLRRLAEQGVLAAEFGGGTVRFVTHIGIGDADIERALTAVERVVRGR